MVTTTKERHFYRMLDTLREVTKAKLSRREMFKLGLVSGAGGVLGLQGGFWLPTAEAKDPPSSPSTRPWAEPLPVPGVLRPQSLGGPAIDPSAHQYYNRFFPQKTYRMRAVETHHSFHPDLPESSIWKFDGRGDDDPEALLGPTLDARYGEPIMMRVENRLPGLDSHTGFGIPQVITHLHNAHTASESDGGPWNWTDPGGHTDHHFCMAHAGFSVPDTIPKKWRAADGGDIREAMTTLFFHYHRPEFTSDGVYKGLLNFVRFFDDKDTGDETDGNGWQLPSGDYDIPLLISDKRFDRRTGELVFDQFNVDGHLGDKVTVNGKIQPFVEVKRRKYRVRLLDGSPSRFYGFVLRYDRKNQPFTQITDNGNFLVRPRTLKKLELWPAERSDIIIDFSQFPAGSKVYLANILPMKDGRGPDRGKRLNPNRVENQLIEFQVGADAADPSRVPDFFRPFPPINLDEVVKRRVWRFERGNGMWQINDKVWDPDIDHTPERLANPPVQIQRNTAEIWELHNNSGGWEHPIHIHFEEGQILKINDRKPRANEKARFDMYRLKGNTKIELFMRFRDFPDPDFNPSPPVPLGKLGRHVMHCHNLTHEDHAMMTTWNIVPEVVS